MLTDRRRALMLAVHIVNIVAVLNFQQWSVPQSAHGAIGGYSLRPHVLRSAHPAAVLRCTRAIQLQTMPTTMQSTVSAGVLVPAPPSIEIARPKIHFTVPGTKPGWKDQNGRWFDEDGPRKGPPPNHWRASLDQRAYEGDMAILDAVLQAAWPDELIKARELRQTIARPSINRKTLGRWAVLASRSNPTVEQKSAEEDAFLVSYTVEVFRTAGKKLGPKNHYGQFDAHLEDGEEVSLTVCSGDRCWSAQMEANSDNSVVQLGSFDALPLSFGGITYLSDYLLIMRDPTGAVDVWLRL